MAFCVPIGLRFSSWERSCFSPRSWDFALACGNTPEQRKAHHGQSGTLQGALLGLLGLLLGFTFAMAVGRYEARKQLVLDEANGIGTAWRGISE